MMELPTGYKFFLFSLIVVCGSLQKETELHIGTLIPAVYTNDTFGLKTAIDIAAETIRAHPSLLKGYKLVFHHKDTKLTADAAIQSLIELRSNQSSPRAVKICILGPATSKVAVYTAKLASVWGTLQLSYGASSLELISDTYPRFLSIVPTSNSLNIAVIEVFKYFGWKRVAMAYAAKDKSFFLPTMNVLKTKLEANKIDIVLEEGIDLIKNPNAKKLFIQKLKEKDSRIVIALFESEDVIKLMCEAYKQGFYGRKIMWITYLASFRFQKEHGCNRTEFELVSEGMFNMDHQYRRMDANKTLSGLTAQEFRRRMFREMARRNLFRSFDPTAYMAFDSTWLLALSLNDSLHDAVTMQTLRFHNTTYSNLTDKLRKRMISMEFEGITGKVKFNSSERLGTVLIKQRRQGYFVNVAQYHTASNVLTFFPNQSKPEVLFRGTKFLQDGPRYIWQVRHYSLSLLVVIWTLCVLAVIIALALFYFNFKNRNIRYIKMSSPHVNNVIILGGLVCYIKVMLDTLDSRFFGLEAYGFVCNVRVWFMSLGFTTAFGAMFSKTWRVHRIFTASKNFRRAVIKNFHLYGLLLALLGVDCILLTLWMIVSPYQSENLQLPTEDNTEEDAVIHPFIYHCTSKHGNYFLITTLCCKGLLLVFGIFLAWETRNIEIKALNDSKYIGISVYNVVILSVLGVILATFISETGIYNVYLALMSFVVILCTAATLGIVFVPKIIGLQRIITSTANEAVETTYSVKSSGDSQSQCCCCEDCKCRCSGLGRKPSIHVSNKFLAGASSNRKKSRAASVPSISVTKPKVSVHINARVSLSTYPISESPSASPDESPRAGFLTEA